MAEHRYAVPHDQRIMHGACARERAFFMTSCHPNRMRHSRGEVGSTHNGFESVCGNFCFLFLFFLV